MKILIAGSHGMIGSAVTHHLVECGYEVTRLVRQMPRPMGEEFILSSRRIQPAKLLAAGYQFRFPELEQALQHELERLNSNGK